MQVLVVIIQILMGWFLFQILREIKLTKCAINRLERLRKHLSFNCINKNRGYGNKNVQLFPINDAKGFAEQYKTEVFEELQNIENEHIFTRDEIAKMTTEEFIKNEPAINRQMAQGLI